MYITLKHTQQNPTQLQGNIDMIQTQVGDYTASQAETETVGRWSDLNARAELSGNELAEARWGLHLNSISLGTNGFLMACHERGSVTSSPGAWPLTLLTALPQIQTAWHPATCLFPHQKAAFPPSPDNWGGHGWRRSVHWRGRHSLQARSSSPTGLSLWFMEGNPCLFSC